MKLYIFGAGASKGAVESLDNSGLNFPETKELFDKRYSLYWQQVFFPDRDIDRLRDDLGEQDFEAWLTDKWKEIESISSSRVKNIKLREFGRLTLYFWNLFNSLSNYYQEHNEYRKLVEGLNQSGDDYGFISFNYDTFLDQALREVNGGVILSNRDDYVKEGIIKPHGSVNWFLTRRGHDRETERYNDSDLHGRLDLVCSQMYDGLLFHNEHFSYVGPGHDDLRNIWTLISERFHRQYFYPLIFIPMTSKLTNFVENFYDESIQNGIELIEKADEIFIIGYKAKDDAIRKMLIKAKPGTKLNVVSNSNAQVISTQVLSWATNLEKGSIINGGFQEFNKRHFERSS